MGDLRPETATACEDADLERARAWCEGFRPDLLEDVRSLARLLAEVRREERARIVSWLREYGVGTQGREWNAEMIERGDYLLPSIRRSGEAKTCRTAPATAPDQPPCSPVADGSGAGNQSGAGAANPSAASAPSPQDPDPPPDPGGTGFCIAASLDAIGSLPPPRLSAALANGQIVDRPAEAMPCGWCVTGVDCPRHPRTGNEEDRSDGAPLHSYFGFASDPGSECPQAGDLVCGCCRRWRQAGLRRESASHVEIPSRPVTERPETMRDHELAALKERMLTWTRNAIELKALRKVAEAAKYFVRSSVYESYAGRDLRLAFEEWQRLAKAKEGT